MVVPSPSSSEPSSPLLLVDGVEIKLATGPEDYYIAVLKSLTSNWQIRLEYDEQKKELRQAMSANFIFIHLPKEMDPNIVVVVDTVIQQLREKFQRTEIAVTTEPYELWIETDSSFMKRVCV